MYKDFIGRQKMLWEVPPGWREKQEMKKLREIRKLKLKNIFNKK